MRFILGNNEVIQPAGMADLSLEKIRDKKLWGFVRKEMAYVKGIGECSFFEKKAIDILQSAYNESGIDAETLFTVEDDEGNQLFQSEVDYANFREDGKNFFANFRDRNGVVEFDSQRSMIVSIVTNSSIKVLSQKIIGAVSHQFEDASRIIELGKSGVFLDSSHTFPLKVKVKDSIGKGTGLSVMDPYKHEPIWLNTTEENKIVRVGAKFDCQINISSTATITSTPVLEVYNQANDKILEKKLAPIIIPANTNFSCSYFVDETISVPIDGFIVLTNLVQYSTTNSSYYKFEYQTSSFLSIEEDISVPDSNVPGINIFDAFEQIISKISGGLLTLNSPHLQKSGWFLTNGLNLRAVNAPINLSFDQLFEDLQKLECLSCGIYGNNVVIAPLGSVFSDLGLTLGNLSAINYRPLTDLLYSEVKAGCTNWKSDTPSGNMEVNALATYSTSIKKINQLLDLTLKNISTSSRLIEVVRRLQYFQSSSSAQTDTKNDNTLFLIDCDGATSIVGKNGLNEVASPYNMLKNWSYVLAGNKELIFSSQEGNTTAVDESGRLNLTASAFGDRMAVLEAPEVATTYINTDNILSFNDGGTLKRIFVTEMSYRWGGDNKLVAHGYLLNDNFIFKDSEYLFSRKNRSKLT